MAFVTITNGKATAKVEEKSFERIWKERGWKLAEKDKQPQTTPDKGESRSVPTSGS